MSTNEDREQRPAALSEAKPHRSFSEKTMKDHDDLVRAAASHKAWLDLLERFSPKQRRDLAMLMAHNWTVSAIEIQTSMNSSGKSDKRYDAETTVAQLFPNGPLKPRASGADRERAITDEPVAHFQNDAADGQPPHYSQIAAEYIGTEGTFPLYRAAPVVRVPVAVDSYCWLVELRGPLVVTPSYHTGFVTLTGESRSTQDPYTAKRYSSLAEAERIAAKLGFNLVGTWAAVEHCFAAPITGDTTKDQS